jgi:hypothetical protein
LKHFVSSATKAYIRFKDNIPETSLLYSAYDGFTNLGAEVVTFNSTDDVRSLNDLGSETLICGYISDVLAGLDNIGAKRPKTLDYPDCLKQFYFRDIQICKMFDVRFSKEKCFIKPVAQKLFTGFVFDGSDKSRLGVALIDDNELIYKSEVKKIVAEYRCIMLDGEILDIRRYRGDWSVLPDKEIVNEAIRIFKESGEAPICHTIDFGIDSDGKTFIVELNDGFAFGHYGIGPTAYASCLAARWKEMVENGID